MNFQRKIIIIGSDGNINNQTDEVIISSFVLQITRAVELCGETCKTIFSYNNSSFTNRVIFS